MIPVVDGGFWEEDSGTGEDYVSTRGWRFNKEFNVLAKMLKQIEPLDTSVIGKGASSTSKEAMKRTISSMLGVLPSNRFQVTVGLSGQPLLVFFVVKEVYIDWLRVFLLLNLPKTCTWLSFIEICYIHRTLRLLGLPLVV